MAVRLLAGCAAVASGGAQKEAERVRRAAGRPPLKMASARRGQGEPGAWRPRGGHHLTSVGHDWSEARVSDYNGID